MKKQIFKIIDFKDNKGNPVQVGDIIKVTLPEVEYIEPYNGLSEGGGHEDFCFAPEVELLALLHCTASQGLVIKVTEILTPQFELKNSDLKLNVGDRRKFKHSAWEWKLHEIKTPRCKCGSTNCVNSYTHTPGNSTVACGDCGIPF